MARYIADQNKVVFQTESGTYANASGAASTGQWIGQVTEHSVTDTENKIVSRFLGTATRSLDTTELGPRDVTGTLTYHPQDMRLVFWAIGSTNDVSGTASEHVVTEINTNVWTSPFVSGTGQLNAPISFTLEDSKQAPGTGRNFIRTINGCVPTTTTLTATQGEKVNVEMEYIGQTLTYSSGTTLSVTEETQTPYLWSDGTLTVSGMTIDTAKEVALTINNNIEPQHYVNGSRDIGVPFPKNRDTTLSVTFDLDAASDKATTIYETLYKTNSVFNTTFTLDRSVTAGSQEVTFTLSGCRVTSMENPSTNEGVTESTMEIMVERLLGSAIDSTALTNTYNFGF